MIKIIAILFAILVAAILVYAATRPDSFRIERSATIKAAPEKVFPLINDFHSGRPGRHGRRSTPG